MPPLPADSDSDDDDDVPLSQRAVEPPPAPAPAPAPHLAPRPAPAPAKAPAPAADGDSSEEDAPLSEKRKPPPAAAPPAKKPKAPAASNGKAKAAPAPAPKKRAVQSESDDDDDESSDDDDESESEYEEEKKPKKAKAPAKAGSSSKPPPPKKKAKPSRDDDDDSDDGAPGGSGGGGKKWFEGGIDPEEVEWKRGGKKWRTLEHAGVIFPPLYEPHGIKLVYDGKPVELTTDQEEVATMYAAMLTTDYVKKEAFQRNFMASWRPLLKKSEAGKPVKDLALCDFTAIAAHLDAQRELKKGLSAELKRQAKAAKDKEEAPFMYAQVDGAPEKVPPRPPARPTRAAAHHPTRARRRSSPFPPSPSPAPARLRRWATSASSRPASSAAAASTRRWGSSRRASSPRCAAQFGAIRRAILRNSFDDPSLPPQDITINIGKRAKVPPVPDIGDGKKHNWGDVVHVDTVTWLAKWKDSINGEDKCVWLAANSSWKGKSDLAKYEKARKLKDHIGKVREDYMVVELVT